jgi:hypothetical protein
MQDPNFKSQFKVIYNEKEYPVVILIDYTNDIVSFQDLPYHPSEIYTRPLNTVELIYTPQ